MLTIQLLILAFVVFALSRVLVRFRDGGLSRTWLTLWMLVWCAVAVAALLPQTTSWFAQLVGVGRGADAVMYVSIIGLFYLVFRVFVRLERLDHDISLLVRELGLRALGKPREDAGEEDSRS